MGYRYYFYEVDKTTVNDIRRCKTEEDLYNFYVQNNIECNKHECGEETEYYCPIYKLGKELFGFGSYYDNANEIYKHGDSLFTSTELNERYNDYEAIVCDESAILCAIEWQKQHIIKMYECLVNNTFEFQSERYCYPDEIDDKELHYQRLLQNAKHYLRWWNPEYGDYTAINIDKNKDNVVESWLYEHTIFDLVRIYKTFDWENKCLLFLGW